MTRDQALNIRIGLLFVVLIFTTNCQEHSKFPEMSFPPDKKEVINIEEAAIRIVSKDAKSVVGKDDIRFKRVKYLLNELTKESSLSVYDCGNLLEVSTKILEDKNGVKLSLQEFLEEMKKVKDSGLAVSLNQTSDFMTLASLASVRKGR